MFLGGAIAAGIAGATVAIEENRQFEQRMSLLSPEEQAPIRAERAKRQEAEYKAAQRRREAERDRQGSMSGPMGFIWGLIIGSSGD